MKGTLHRAGTARKPSGSRRPGTPRKASRPVPAPRPDTSRRPSRRAVALGTGVCLALAALVVTAVTLLGGGEGHPADEVASLDGHPVTRDELLFHMRRLAPTVQNELSGKYHLQSSTFSWSANTGGQTALRRLETRALDEIWQDKTTLLLARKQGLVDSVDFADLLAERTRENESRAQAVAEGQTVYGVTDFTPEEYYTHRLTELTTSLEDKLGAAAGDPLWVTDAEVRHAFDSDPDAWSADATTYTYEQLVVQVPDGASADWATRLRRRVTAAGHLSALSGVTGAKLTTSTYKSDGSTGLSTHDQDLLAVLGKLGTGGISAPVKGTGQVTYYQLDRRKVDEDKAFAAYSERIRQSLVEKKFTQYLQRRVDDADTHVDTAAVDAVNAKDVKQ